MSIQAIQKKASEHKGSYVHFSQGEEPTRTLINMLPYTKNGICQALAAKWITEHAGGDSLWNWIFIKGTKNVQQAKIANLMINFTESVQKTGKLSNPTTSGKDTKGDFYQDFVTDKYFELYGLKRRNLAHPAFMGSMAKQVNHGYGPKTGQILCWTLTEKYMNTKGGSYVLISIMGKAGGHAMAAYVGEDIAFFDPNYGEFWFPNVPAFQKWFEHFWQLSGYQPAFNAFYLLPYAPAMKFAKPKR